MICLTKFLHANVYTLVSLVNHEDWSALVLKHDQEPRYHRSVFPIDMHGMCVMSVFNCVVVLVSLAVVVVRYWDASMARLAQASRFFSCSF